MKDTKKFFKITFTGIMIALMFVFSWTILGMVPIGTFASATTVFIPVIIGIVCLDDFRYTIVLSISFGVISLIRALAPQGILDPYFVNPLVSVLPRFLMGIVTHLFYRLIKKLIKNNSISSMLTGAVGAFTNTLFTMSMLLVVYFNDLVKLLTEEGNMTIKIFLGTVALTNMIPEIVLGMIVCFVVMRIYDKHMNK